MTAQAEQLYTTTEACERLAISERTLRRIRKKVRLLDERGERTKRVKVVRFGRAVRYSESTLAAIIEARSREIR